MSAITEFLSYRATLQQMRRLPAGHRFTIRIQRPNRDESSAITIACTIVESDRAELAALNLLLDSTLAKLHELAKAEAHSVLDES